MKAVLADLETAPISEPLRATLRVLRKLVLTPEDVTPADAERARAAGVSDDALLHAMYVMYLFSVYNRMSDALGWTLQSPDGTRRTARILLRMGYDI